MIGRKSFKNGFNWFWWCEYCEVGEQVLITPCESRHGSCKKIMGGSPRFGERLGNCKIVTKFCLNVVKRLWGKACRHLEIIIYSLNLITFTCTTLCCQLNPHSYQTSCGSLPGNAVTYNSHTIYSLETLKYPDIDYQSTTCDQSVCLSDSSLMWVVNLQAKLYDRARQYHIDLDWLIDDYTWKSYTGVKEQPFCDVLSTCSNTSLSVDAPELLEGWKKSWNKYRKNPIAWMFSVCLSSWSKISSVLRSFGWQLFGWQVFGWQVHAPRFHSNQTHPLDCLSCAFCMTDRQQPQKNWKTKTKTMTIAMAVSKTKTMTKTNAPAHVVIPLSWLGMLLFIKRVGGDLANPSSHPRLLLQRRPEWFGGT